MSHERAETLMQEAEQALRQCQADFEDGREVNVQPVEAVSREFCEILQELPIEEVRRYEEPLKALMLGLEALQLLLQARRDELKNQIQGLGNQQRARDAYSKTSNLKESKD